MGMGVAGNTGKFGLMALVAAGLLAGCKEEKNAYVAPPPPKVGVSAPLKQTVTPYLQTTGNTVAVNQIDLVARVEGFLQEIDYTDGQFVKTGTKLFVIEPPPYQAKFAQAQAAVESAKADLAQAQAEFSRQSQLAAKDFASQATLDQARAKLGSIQGTLDGDIANLQTAAINLSYTQVNAPFDGVVTKHLIDIGALVGGTTPTTLATLVQMNPIYVTFNVSEQDVLNIRASHPGVARMDAEQLAQIPVEVGTMTEDGYPHVGKLNYVSPEIDPSTGTLLARGIFENDTRALLPGFFVRVRVPTVQQPDQLLVPDVAVGANQAGRYLLVVDKDNVVQQRKVTIGQQVGSLRVILSGLQPDDQVVVNSLQKAIPGDKVDPQPATIAQTDVAAVKP